MEILSFSYQGDFFCVKVTDVHEVINSVAPVLLPRIPDPFEGVFQHRGNVFSLMSFGRCMNDDINFLAMNQENYVKWYSHYNFTPAVKFDRKMEGKFKFKAESGQTYYFVFDNFFSTVSNKKIKVKIKLIPEDDDDED